MKQYMMKVQDPATGTYVQQYCEVQGCQKPATTFAAEHDDIAAEDMAKEEISKPQAVCEEHAKEIASKRKPEHVAVCPRCGCRFGVN